MTDRLNGRIALVTGAATGIGRATAERLTREGAMVVAGVADEGQSIEVASASAFDVQVLDVRSEVDWDRVMAHVETEHGGLDILVNNAGIHRSGTAPETAREVWDEVMAVNLWGTFLGCKWAVEAMRRRGGGAIVNLCSMNALVGVPRSVAYTTSKGGVLSLTRAMAMDHVGDAIRINCICPGPVETPIIDALFASRGPDPKAARATAAATIPMARIAAPEEIAAAIAFLVSDDASFMTGAAVPVDGGRTIRGTTCCAGRRGRTRGGDTAIGPWRDYAAVNSDPRDR
jgi:NAD(P)-dependent dehydrogenase (short-subunit alcohol dehydrogenase family)